MVDLNSFVASVRVDYIFSENHSFEEKSLHESTDNCNKIHCVQFSGLSEGKKKLLIL